jgi:hypothetical protein
MWTGSACRCRRLQKCQWHHWTVQMRRPGNSELNASSEMIREDRGDAIPAIRSNASSGSVGGSRGDGSGGSCRGSRRASAHRRASHACGVNDVSGSHLRVRFKCYVLEAVPQNVTLMSRRRETLQRSLLALINANGYLDIFELTALAYGLEPDEQGKVVVSAARLASVRRALVVLVREGLVISSTARAQGGRRASATPEYAGRPWFWIELDDIEGREPFACEG